MTKSVNLDRITVDGNTIDLQEVEPSDDYESLIVTGLSPRQNKVSVVYELRSNTPTSDLETMFASDYTVEPAGSTHKLVVSGGGLEVVFGNPSLEN